MPSTAFWVPVPSSNVDAIRLDVIAFFVHFNDNPRRAALEVRHAWIAGNRHCIWGWVTSALRWHPVAYWQEAQPFHFTIHYGYNVTDDEVVRQEHEFDADPLRALVSVRGRDVVHLEKSITIRAPPLGHY